MSTWLLVWFVVTIVAAVAMIGVVAALVWQGILLLRTARRMQEEIAPITQQLMAGVDQASRRASTLRR